MKNVLCLPGVKHCFSQTVGRGEQSMTRSVSVKCANYCMKIKDSKAQEDNGVLVAGPCEMHIYLSGSCEATPFFSRTGFYMNTGCQFAINSTLGDHPPGWTVHQNYTCHNCCPFSSASLSSVPTLATGIMTVLALSAVLFRP